MDENVELDNLEEIESPIHVITIVIDESNGLPPRVDLGDISPIFAHTILQTVVDTLYDCIPSPEIVYDGVTLMDYDYAGWDDEDED